LKPSANNRFFFASAKNSLPLSMFFFLSSSLYILDLSTLPSLIGVSRNSSTGFEIGIAPSVFSPYFNRFFHLGL
jgi:hypothetical protein